jgi:hypothetical protein
LHQLRGFRDKRPSNRTRDHGSRFGCIAGKKNQWLSAIGKEAKL